MFIFRPSDKATQISTGEIIYLDRYDLPDDDAVFFNPLCFIAIGKDGNEFSVHADDLRRLE